MLEGLPYGNVEGARSRVQNPVEVLTFSNFYIRNCINCVHNCNDHSLLEVKVIAIKVILFKSCLSLPRSET